MRPMVRALTFAFAFAFSTSGFLLNCTCHPVRRRGSHCSERLVLFAFVVRPQCLVLAASRVNSSRWATKLCGVNARVVSHLARSIVRGHTRSIAMCRHFAHVSYSRYPSFFAWTHTHTHACTRAQISFGRLSTTCTASNVS